MKWILKLLKDWKDDTGQEFKAGDVIEIEDKDVAAKMILDDIAEKTEKTNDDSNLEKAVNKAVKDGLKVALKPFEEKINKIEVHDKSDDDPSHGFIPEVVGREHTLEEKQYGLSVFCQELHAAGPGFANPSKRMKKSHDRAEADRTKAAGDGVNIGIPSEGGIVALPPEINTMLADGALEAATIRPRASTSTTQSSSVILPRLDNYDHSSNLVFGAVIAYFRGENAQLTESKPKWEQIEIPVHELTALTYVSDQMMKFSSLAIGSRIMPLMAAAINWKEEDTFINGTGAGMPLGMLAAPSKIEIAIESGQTLAGSAIVTDNILKQFQRLRIEKSASTIFLYNKVDLFYWLSLLTIDVGTGGSAAGLIQRVPGAPDMNLLGIPLVDTEHCQAAGTPGDIILTDASQYVIVDHASGSQAAQSIHLKFDYAQTALRIIKYVGGQPAYSKVFTRQNSTNTSAPVMTIATRS